jgi:hypothetical protein
VQPRIQKTFPGSLLACSGCIAASGGCISLRVFFQGELSQRVAVNSRGTPTGDICIVTDITRKSAIF